MVQEQSRHHNHHHNTGDIICDVHVSGVTKMLKINRITSAKPQQDTIIKTINQLVDRVNKDTTVKQSVRKAIGKLKIRDIGLDDVTPVKTAPKKAKAATKKKR